MFFSQRFARFVVFGGLAAVANIAVGSALYTNPKMQTVIPYWLAVGIGSASGLLLNFFLNYAYNFGYSGRPAGAQLRTFVIVACGGVVLTALLAEGMMQLAHLASFPERYSMLGFTFGSQWTAHVIATGLVTFYSFAAHSAFSFNEGLRKRLPAFLGKGRSSKPAGS